MKTHLYFIPAFLTILTFSCQPKQKKTLKMSELFSDHMVLQQQHEVNFWGEYTPGQQLTLSGSWGAEISTNADTNGIWKMKLNTPDAGGPYSIKIVTRDSTIVIEDVLVGEVWLASGQSNMEMPVKGWLPNDPILNSKQEIIQANYPDIRMLTVKKNLSGSPLDFIEGQWTSASPKTVGDFSATAYFFARKLQQELKVPIGIIHSSWGGTVAEAWTSKGYLEKLGDFDETINSFNKPEFKNLTENTENWFKQWPTHEIPDTDEQWQKIDFSDIRAAESDFDDSYWDTMELPGRYDQLSTGEFDGAMWLRKEFIIHDTTVDYILKIMAIDDMDASYINGQKIGGLAGAGFSNVPREITIPKSLLVQGSNIIAIRAIDTGGPGSITGPMTISNNKGDNISIEGTWKTRLVAEIFNETFYTYNLKVGVSERPHIFQFHPNLPTVLFNGMINPLVPYTIKGAIWYQGESNVGRDEQYKQLFPTMIKDWRNKWGYDFPFYFVQIAPYIYNPNPSEQVSQKLRDAQRYSLNTPKTGMVVTLDIGNPTNIHPANKQEVGKRLARLALANDYGKKLVPSGPLYKQIKKLGSKLIVEFDNIGSGLAASFTGLSGFEIAGLDKVYVPAVAKIIENKIEVTSPLIASPQYVRYAWRDASAASLFNLEGLPASSFTSDE
ncbi:sialate O-acetylesterase [Maribacter sp.]|uniref:sialate O-acetylesterase n=1 Tax=Maribacter sp. TaxID=1897614 RepID=UPI0025BA2A57|nr:sialate O-acetylesterase [Maribacter sp.]